MNVGLILKELREHRVIPELEDLQSAISMDSNKSHNFCDVNGNKVMKWVLAEFSRKLTGLLLP
jgi:hypothetical protein